MDEGVTVMHEMVFIFTCMAGHRVYVNPDLYKPDFYAMNWKMM